MCLPTTVWAKLMIQHYFQHLLPCFIPRLDTTSTRYLLILSMKLLSQYHQEVKSIFSISIFSLQGASCKRWAFGKGQGGWDLREEWDESCLCGGRKLQMEQCFQVKWITIAIPTTNQVCDHATQHGLCFLWKQKHFSQGKLRFLVVVLDETNF